MAKTIQFIDLNNTPYEKMNTRELVVSLFQKNPTDTYNYEEDIVDAIKKHFNISRQQPSISKVITELDDTKIIISEHKFFIGCFRKMYRRVNAKDYPLVLATELKDRTCFRDDTTYSLSDYIYAYNVDQINASFVRKVLLRLYGSTSFVDIVPHNGKLYILLNNNSLNIKYVREKIRRFPSLLNNNVKSVILSGVVTDD